MVAMRATPNLFVLLGLKVITQELTRTPKLVPQWCAEDEFPAAVSSAVHTTLKGNRRSSSRALNSTV